MSEHNITRLSWAPSEQASKRALGFFTFGAALIGVVGFSVSFDSVMLAARPYLGMASWCVPVMVDLAIFVLTGLALFMELHGLGARWIRLIPTGLALWTLYLNTAEQRQWFGKAVHAVGPALWIVTVEIAAFAVRKLIGLTDEKRIEGLRRSLWLLRPVATWRIWAQMRIHQITTYREALDRDAARAAVVGRLRVSHGRLWRQKAPLAERIALRLQGRDPDGVAQILTAHQETAALLTGTATEPVPEPAPEPVESAPEALPRETEKPRRKSSRSRTRKAAKTPAPRRSDEELFAEASALNALVLAETGAPASLRRIKTQLRVGQPVAERLRDRLATAPALSGAGADIPQHLAVPEPVPAADDEDGAAYLVEYANGTPV